MPFSAVSGCYRGTACRKTLTQQPQSAAGPFGLMHPRSPQGRRSQPLVVERHRIRVRLQPRVGHHCFHSVISLLTRGPQSGLGRTRSGPQVLRRGLEVGVPGQQHPCAVLNPLGLVSPKACVLKRKSCADPDGSPRGCRKRLIDAQGPRAP